MIYKGTETNNDIKKKIKSISAKTERLFKGDGG